MNEIDKEKYLAKIKKSKNEVPKEKYKYLKKIGLRFMASIVLFLIVAIFCKSNITIKEIIYDKVYNTNFSFTKVKNFYDKYLGGILPLDKIAKNIEPVFSEKLTYSSKSLYYDGVKLEVTTNYLVPSLKSGLVVYVGEKENYGNCIIIQGVDGIDIWYGNMNTTVVNLYDYVDEGTLLGEVNDNFLYLVYYSDGKYLNYEEYIS